MSHDTREPQARERHGARFGRQPARPPRVLVSVGDVNDPDDWEVILVENDAIDDETALRISHERTGHGVRFPSLDELDVSAPLDALPDTDAELPEVFSPTEAFNPLGGPERRRRAPSISQLLHAPAPDDDRPVDGLGLVAADFAAPPLEQTTAPPAVDDFTRPEESGDGEESSPFPLGPDEVLAAAGSGTHEERDELDYAAVFGPVGDELPVFDFGDESQGPDSEAEPAAVSDATKRVPAYSALQHAWTPAAAAFADDPTLAVLEPEPRHLVEDTRASRRARQRRRHALALTLASSAFIVIAAAFQLLDGGDRPVLGQTNATSTSLGDGLPTVPRPAADPASTDTTDVSTTESDGSTTETTDEKGSRTAPTSGTSPAPSPGTKPSPTTTKPPTTTTRPPTTTTRPPTTTTTTAPTTTTTTAPPTTTTTAPTTTTTTATEPTPETP